MFNRIPKDQMDEVVSLRFRYEPGRLDKLMEITKFTKHEIRMLYQGFKQECPSGEVNEDTFKKIFSQFFPQGNASHYAHYVFRTLKKASRNSPCLNFEDLIVMLSHISRGTSNEKLAWIFKLYDQNADGYITKNEMLIIVQAIYDMVGESTIPIVNSASAQEHVDLIFNQIDENNDGLITFEDLSNWCQRVENSHVDLLFYYDSLEQWPKVYKTNKSCKQKYKVLNTNSTQIISLKLGQPYINCTKFFKEKVSYIRCTCVGEFLTLRERWWYLVVSNCNSQDGLDVYYNLTLLNTKSNWLKHFSADEYAVFPINIITLFIYGLLIICIIFQCVQLIERKYFHITYKLFIGSVISQFIGLLFIFIYFFQYSNDGYSNKTYRIIGKGFTMLSNLSFLLLLILLAKGFTITRARLKTNTSVKVAIFMTIYTLLHIFLYFYEQCCFDPAEVLYTYEGWIGYYLIVLRIFGLIWFTNAIFKTVNLYPTKKKFFYIFYFMYFIWFVSLPIIIILATFVIAKYQREQIVYAVENIVLIKAHFFFLMLTWPFKFNKCFPFHVRTSQIGAMEKINFNKKNKIINTIESSGETLDKFSHYKYAPTKNKNNSTSEINHKVIFEVKNTKINHSLGESNYNLSNKSSTLPDIN